MKKILFRADGNAQIGAGHIMRCLSLGMAARELGILCKYVTADDSFSGTIKEYGFECEILHTDYYDMEQELNKCLEVIQKFRPDVILADGYYATHSYLTELKKYAKLAYIDDIKSFAYPVDVLINYNSGAMEMNYPKLYQDSKTELPQLILGEHFVPLRQEFQNLKRKPVKSKVTDILFSAGGADPERIALRFVREVVHNEQLSGYKFHLVLGAFEPDVEEIKKLAEKHTQICIHQNVKKMSELMQQCDMAVSAAGSTLYELCACGMPTITYVLADNQKLGESSLCGKGVMKSAGDVRTKTGFWDDLMEMMYLLAENCEERQKMRESAVRTVDGMGAEHIIKNLMSSEGKDVS